MKEAAPRGWRYGTWLYFFITAAITARCSHPNENSTAHYVPAPSMQFFFYNLFYLFFFKISHRWISCIRKYLLQFLIDICNIIRNTIIIIDTQKKIVWNHFISCMNKRWNDFKQSFLCVSMIMIVFLSIIRQECRLKIEGDIFEYHLQYHTISYTDL